MDTFDTKELGKILISDDEDAGNCPMPMTEFPKHTPVAMAYIPFQQWEEPYDTETALSRGTIFPSLDKPFIGEEAVRRADLK